MTTFKGFQIKGIDEKRVPDPREAGAYRVGSHGVNFQHYTVYLILEPIKDSEEDQAIEVGSDIRRIWGECFTNLAEKRIDGLRVKWQERCPRMPGILSMRLEYCDNGDYGEIRIVETHFEEVEDISEISRELIAETNRRTLENLDNPDERGAHNKTVWEMTSRRFSH